MRRSRIVWGLVFVAASTSGAWATKLDKASCNLLDAELAGLAASGTRDDMARGPQWALANLSPLKLRNIQRLIELEEQLEFRCGMKYSRIVAIEAEPPKGSNGKVVVPARPEPKPTLKTNATKPRDKVEKSQSDTGAKAAAAMPSKPDVAPGAASRVETASTQPPAAPSPAKAPHRHSSAAYVSPADVNPFFVTRHGDSQ